jgi:hypothetical protein
VKDFNIFFFDLYMQTSNMPPFTCVIKNSWFYMGVKLGLSGKRLFENKELRRIFISDVKKKEQKDGENHTRRRFNLYSSPTGRSYHGG